VTIARDVYPYWAAVSAAAAPGTPQDERTVDGFILTKPAADLLEGIVADAQAAIKAKGMKALNDDRAETLLGHLTRYYVESNRP